MSLLLCAVGVCVVVAVLRRRSHRACHGARRDGGGTAVVTSPAPASPPSVEELADLVRTTPATHWTYKAEGNANVVLYYTGPDVRLAGRTIRVAKTHGTPSATLHACGRTPALPHSLIDAALFPADALAFADNVVRPLIGSKFVIPGRRVAVDAARLRALGERVTSAANRPASRKALHVDMHSGGVVLMWDQTMVPTLPGCRAVSPSLCVELKPKWGLLPQPGCGADSAGGSTCRFCMHQALKQASGKEAFVSRYCPIDLFSNEPARVRQALANCVQCPQNNFRVFRDGQPVFTAESAPAGDTAAHEATLCRVLAGTPFAVPATDGAAGRLLDVVAALLCGSGVLNNLRAAQQLDRLGVAAAHECARAAVEASGAAGLQDTSRLREWLTSGAGAGADAAQQLAEFLVAATLKDSSLMLALQVVEVADACAQLTALPHHLTATPLDHLLPPSHPLFAAGLRSPFVVHGAALVDLDPKPLARLPRFLQVDKDVTSAYEASGWSCVCTPPPPPVRTPDLAAVCDAIPAYQQPQ